MGYLAAHAGRISAPQRLPCLCLVAGHRAPTTALGTALEGSGAFAGLGEIFQTGRPHACPDYALAQNLPLSTLLSEAQAARMFDTHLDSPQAAAAPRILLNDVKLYAWAVQRQARAIIHSERLIWEQLAQGGRIRVTTCEALFDERGPAEPLQDWLTDTSGLRPGAPFRPRIARTEVGAEAAVANHAEIAAAVAALSRRENRLRLWQEGPDQPIR